MLMCLQSKWDFHWWSKCVFHLILWESWCNNVNPEALHWQPLECPSLAILVLFWKNIKWKKCRVFVVAVVVCFNFKFSGKVRFSWTGKHVRLLEVFCTNVRIKKIQQDSCGFPLVSDIIYCNPTWSRSEAAMYFSFSVSGIVEQYAVCSVSKLQAFYNECIFLNIVVNISSHWQLDLEC